MRSILWRKRAHCDAATVTKVILAIPSPIPTFLNLATLMLLWRVRVRPVQFYLYLLPRAHLLKVKVAMRTSRRHQLLNLAI